MNEHKVYIKSDYEKLLSLIGDEAKNAAMLEELSHTLRQLRAKSTFRLALLHQLRENIEAGKNK